MKTIKTIKTIIAAALALTGAAAHAEQQRTEGHVENFHVTCGDHFVQVFMTDKVLSGGFIDDAPAKAFDLEHKVHNGKVSVLFSFGMSVNAAERTATGYTLDMNQGTGTIVLTPVTFKIDNQAQKAIPTPAGKPSYCHA
ncbi:hypothetical protein MRQ47_004428 [Salmonella enterica]|nr:hypothetical protein [Salmonella enterica]